MKEWWLVCIGSVVYELQQIFTAQQFDVYDVLAIIGAYMLGLIYLNFNKCFPPITVLKLAN
ncbi:hypothetical protein [Alteromonas sp. ASW11-130]|uniref:hypothetical protein n=1 Tax=Alteromonas sp. ASW11-130 TaxID=3015775 RepID=UPI002241B6CD|nr:hypothetical protein [Alteromonas sp. ASW11-130]MCW8090511.1 hypothetical protein [Alteromonas sp. ASW11-130]